MRSLFTGCLAILLGCLFSVRAADQFGRELPDFALLDLRGKQFQLSRTDAMVVVLFFTANGCPIARQSIRAMKALQKENLENNVRFWLVNSTAGENRESVEKEAREFQYGWLPVLLDETQGVAGMLQVRRTPTAV